jgi:hypothetical protein
MCERNTFRLPKDVSIELIKALAVKISCLIDSFKLNSLSPRWEENIEKVTDITRVRFNLFSFIHSLKNKNKKVFFNQSSVEFQHFYELLLAKRLLRDRYISLSTERRVLSQLPASSKCDLMIKDIERSEITMDQFRLYLINRIDYMDLVIPSDISSVALSSDSLCVNILTNSIWPSFWILPRSFSSLCLPSGLDIIKREFINFFSSYDINSAQSWNLNDTRSTFQIHGSEENQARINGIFEPTTEISDGWPIFEMRGNNSSIMEFSAKTNSWQIKKRADKGKNAGWAYCKSSHSNTGPENKNNQWFVWKKSTKKWISQTIKITSMTGSNKNNGCKTSAIQSTNYLSASIRKLIWCHGAGTISLQANFTNNTCVNIICTEPQAAVLFLFNTIISGNDNIVLSFSYLQKTLCLDKEELTETLSTLTSSEIPIITCVQIGNDICDNEFFLSDCFKNGNLESSFNYDQPIILSSIQIDKTHSEAHLIAAGVNSLHGWRNELIDAGIVRILKDSSINKNGEFPNCFRVRFSSLSIDTLSYRVRSLLEERCKVSNEDVMRRRYYIILNLS